MVDRYQPQQRAIVFLEDRTTGGTLGYYCTIVQVCNDTGRKRCDAFEQCVCRVFVPYLNEYKDVRGADLLVTGLSESVLMPEVPDGAFLCELRFDGGLAQDNI